jgi:hypothetical protein
LLEKIGEVIESSTEKFVAECYELHVPPAFGSLVRTREGGIDIYAVVCGAATSSIEAGRRPIARGKGDSNEEDIYRANPQLEKLLRTEFSAMVVGHGDGERICQYMPPRPARIHSFAYPCAPDDVATFNKSLAYLSILVDAPERSNELIAATLRNAAASHAAPRDYLVRAGKELAALLVNDTGRLNSILKKVKA